MINKVGGALTYLSDHLVIQCHQDVFEGNIISERTLSYPIGGLVISGWLFPIILALPSTT